jgi:hypothetical protein
MFSGRAERGFRAAGCGRPYRARVGPQRRPLSAERRPSSSSASIL